MVERRNLKPGLQDSLKKLVSQTTKTHTVPHGVKAAQLGEGTLLEVEPGVEILWDGPQAAAWRADIDQAHSDLDAAELELTALDGRLDGAEDRLGVAELDLNDARLRLTTAEDEITAAELELADHEGRLDVAETRLTGAEADLAEADTRITTAQADATAARARADTAVADVITTASWGDFEPAFVAEHLAQPNNLVRMTHATDPAKSRSGSKYLEGTVDPSLALWAIPPDIPVTPGRRYRLEFYMWLSADHGGSAGMPTMWVRPDGTVHNGDWAPVYTRAHRTEQTVGSWFLVSGQITAPTNVAYLRPRFYIWQSSTDTGITVRFDDFKLVDVTEAYNAQATADGKNTVSYAVNTLGAPATTGRRVGDIHWVVNGSSPYNLIEQWRFNGTAWFKASLDSQVIANLDVGKLTGVFANISQHLQAGSIGTDKMLIGVGQNIVPNGDARSLAGWPGFEQETDTVLTAPDPAAFRRLGNANISSARFRVQPGEYRGRVRYRGEHVGGRTYVQVWSYNLAGTRIGVLNIAGGVDVPNGAWATSEATFTIPDGSIEALVIVYVQHSSGVVDATKRQWFTGIELRQRTAGSLIVDGTIGATQINAESVAGAVGAFEHLVVTEAAILQHTTLLGTTVAEELNVTKQLIARDAIINGTLDVAQLNVTGTMGAQIVLATDVTARRGFFTDGLTAAETTLLGTTVAENVEVDTLGARLMTTEALVVDDADGTVKLTGDGLIVRDKLPDGLYSRTVEITALGLKGGTRTQQTFNLDGSNNWMAGSIETAQAGQRVKIHNTSPNVGSTIAAADFYAADADDHLGVWYENFPHALGPRARVAAMSTASFSSTNSPGFEMYPFAGAFGFRGRWLRDTNAVKMFELINETGLAAGGFSNVWVPYTTAFPAGHMYFPLLTADTVGGVEAVATVNGQDNTGVRIQVNNKSGNKSTGRLIVRGVVFCAMA